MFIDNEFSDLRIIELQYMGLDVSRHGFENENVKFFINRQDLHYDLIFAELFFSESWLMFAHKFNAPIVGLSICALWCTFQISCSLIQFFFI